MKSQTSIHFNALNMTWVIGVKDILDALKHKSSRSNILIMVLMVLFFYWFGILRPFDKEVSVVAYDEGKTGYARMMAGPSDRTTYTFRAASSIQDMEQQMAYKNLGLALPADLDQVLSSGKTLVLQGYIFWADRAKTSQLEAKYTRDFSQILGGSVQVAIGQNIILPQASADGMQANVAHLMVYFIFFTALPLVPHLMLEEKKDRTMDALLVSPASSGVIVLGKALAGFFYVLVIGGLAMALFAQFISDWALALVAFLGYAFLAVGLGLAIGSFASDTKKVWLFVATLMVFLVVPPIFYMEQNLKAGIRAVLTWFPTSALASLFRFSCSTGAAPAQILSNLGVVLASIGIVFALVIWKVRRLDR